jgi:hypothetical protein
MPFTYRSGEYIMEGDNVLIHRYSARIEFVVDAKENPDNWYVKNFGGGFMIVEPTTFGRLFLTPADGDYADLSFVSRR